MGEKTFHARPVPEFAVENLMTQLRYYEVDDLRVDSVRGVVVFSSDDEGAERVRRCRHVSLVEEERGLYLGLRRGSDFTDHK